MQDITVSINMLTYNHSEFIREAIDSILMQKTNFTYEILISDDFSIDDTPKILQEYQEKYPDIIKLVLNEKNIGPSANAYATLTRARGKYIANLEGDDYWTVTDKLQQQVDFLENNPEYIACVHDIIVVDEKSRVIEQNPDYYSCLTEYNWREFENWILAGQTATLVYRNIYIGNDFSEILNADSFAADTSVILLLLGRGKFYKINKVMSHYRRDYRMGSAGWSAIPPFTRSYKILCLMYAYEKYALEHFNIALRFKNKENIIESLFIMRADSPSKYKIDCVQHIMSLGNTTEAERLQRKLYYIIVKTPIHKLSNKYKNHKENQARKKHRLLGIAQNVHLLVNQNEILQEQIASYQERMERMEAILEKLSK